MNKTGIASIIVGVVAIAGIAFAAVYRTHPMIGSGSAPPTAQWYPASTDFGYVEVGAPAERTIRLKNVGNGNLTGTIALATGCASVYSIVSGGGSYSLPRGASRTVVVRFAPADTIPYPQCNLVCGP